jgi:hypothetical protein
MIADEGDDALREVKVIAKKRRVESNLQKWIKNLTLLLKDEQRKVCRPLSLHYRLMAQVLSQYKERKKLVHATVPPGTKIRIPKVCLTHQWMVSWCLTLLRIERLL